MNLIKYSNAWVKVAEIEKPTTHSNVFSKPFPNSAQLYPRIGFKETR